MQNWNQELIESLPFNAHFILSGNIYDSFIYEKGETVQTLTIKDLLKNILIDDGFQNVVSYKPTQGFTLLHGNESILPNSIFGKKESLTKASDQIIKLLRQEDQNNAVIIDYASRSQELSGNDFQSFMALMSMEANESKKKNINGRARHNILIFLVDKEGDIPSFYYVDKPNVKSIIVEEPDLLVRRKVIKNLLKIFQEENNESLVEEIAKQTNKLKIREVIEIFQIAKLNDISPENISEAIRQYRTGVKISPWEEVSRNTLRNLEKSLRKRVKGQDEAVKKVSQSLKRAFFNLSGSQFSIYSQKPKGIFFFAGPTGVGKTELAKAIAESIFGTEDSLIRFDMSEYKFEQSDQKLIGAPPGYLGFQEGGQLTNAVKENPFSVILFDEIEKAHPRILDLLLQVLDDGVLTSGRGERVYFGETVIIFTSNIGASEVSPDMDKNICNRTILSRIEEFFKEKIERPEILNRLGKNIIPFNFITKEEGVRIAKDMILRVLKKIKKEKEIEVSFVSEKNLEQLSELACKDLSMGGRGIGNTIEEIFINPFSEALFDVGARKGDKIMIGFKNSSLQLKVLKFTPTSENEESYEEHEQDSVEISLLNLYIDHPKIREEIEKLDKDEYVNEEALEIISSTIIDVLNLIKKAEERIQKMPTEMKFELNNIKERHIPELIKRYLKIHPEKRDISLILEELKNITEYVKRAISSTYDNGESFQTYSNFLEKKGYRNEKNPEIKQER